jgi:hypothetical protein
VFSSTDLNIAFPTSCRSCRRLSRLCLESCMTLNLWPPKAQKKNPGRLTLAWSQIRMTRISTYGLKYLELSPIKTTASYKLSDSPSYKRVFLVLSRLLSRSFAVRSSLVLARSNTILYANFEMLFACKSIMSKMWVGELP